MEASKVEAAYVLSLSTGTIFIANLICIWCSEK